MAVAAGQTFGNFQVVRLLGEGGFGEVYEAQNPFLQRRAAIKIMHTGMDEDPELVRRFLNEARAASAIRHPNIIDVFDAGVTGEGEPYILMEFLEGDSLQKVIFQQGPVPLGTVQEIAKQAGSALAAAHNAGIVHRDLKPENLFLIPDPSAAMGFRVKVLDFGIAKIKQGEGKGSTLRTQAGLLMGSPSYMSPEQCRDSSDVDLRSDIYSFAIIVYEMLSGKPPFVSESATEMLVMQITADPPPLRELLPDVPDYVEQTVMRALAKDRDKRFGTIDYFVGALCGSYPALTAQGSASAPGRALDGPPSRSFYSQQGYGYVKTPAPLGLGTLGSRTNLTPVPVRSQTISTLTHAKGETGSPSPELSTDSEMETIRPRRWPLLLGVVGLASAAALFVVLRSGGLRTAAPPPAPPVAAKPAPPPVPPSVRLQIRSSPAGASVTDEKAGTMLGTTPLEKTYPRGSGALSLVLRLQGYKDKTVAVGLEGNSSTSVDLEQAAPSATGPAGKPARPVLRAKKASSVRRPPKATQQKDQFKEDEWRVH
jgi:serine/threonine protein kinase